MRIEPAIRTRTYDKGSSEVQCCREHITAVVVQMLSDEIHTAWCIEYPRLFAALPVFLDKFTVKFLYAHYCHSILSLLVLGLSTCFQLASFCLHYNKIRLALIMQSCVQYMDKCDFRQPGGYTGDKDSFLRFPSC